MYNAANKIHKGVIILFYINFIFIPKLQPTSALLKRKGVQQGSKYTRTALTKKTFSYFQGHSLKRILKLVLFLSLEICLSIWTFKRYLNLKLPWFVHTIPILKVLKHIQIFIFQITQDAKDILWAGFIFGHNPSFNDTRGRTR